MNIVKNIATSNICYKSDIPLINIEGISLYYQQSDLDGKGMARYFKMHSELRQGVHLIISEDDSVYMMTPFNRRCWINSATKYPNDILIMIVDTVGIDNDNIITVLGDLIKELIETEIFEESIIEKIRFLNSESEEGLNNNVKNNFLNKLIDYITKEEVTVVDNTVVNNTLYVNAIQVTNPVTEVNVNIKNLKVRARPSDSSPVVDTIGICTIGIVENTVDEKGNAWGLLYEYREKKNGWVKLDLIL